MLEWDGEAQTTSSCKHFIHFPSWRSISCSFNLSKGPWIIHYQHEAKNLKHSQTLLPSPKFSFFLCFYSEIWSICLVKIWIYRVKLWKTIFYPIQEQKHQLEISIFVQVSLNLNDNLCLKKTKFLSGNVCSRVKWMIGIMGVLTKSIIIIDITFN